jgi:hypothetical protein
MTANSWNPRSVRANTNGGGDDLTPEVAHQSRCRVLSHVYGNCQQSTRISSLHPADKVLSHNSADEAHDTSFRGTVGLLVADLRSSTVDIQEVYQSALFSAVGVEPDDSSMSGR